MTYNLFVLFGKIYIKKGQIKSLTFLTKYYNKDRKDNLSFINNKEEKNMRNLFPEITKRQNGIFDFGPSLLEG